MTKSKGTVGVLFAYVEEVFRPGCEATLQVEEGSEKIIKRRRVRSVRSREGEVVQTPTMTGKERVQHVDVDPINVYHKERRRVLGDGKKAGRL